MARGRIRRATAAAALCAALAVTGCSGQRDTNEGRRVEAAIKAFALAHGPDACSMLSNKAITTVYANRVDDERLARSRCLAASSRFRGEPVVVTFVNITKPREAHATARTLNGKSWYGVGLIKLHGSWKIESITPMAKPG
jgi:hypothetical protein